MKKKSPSAPVLKSQLSKGDLMKKFLSSGGHNNDPRKIAAMLKKLNSKEEQEDPAAKNIFAKYGGGSSKEKEDQDKIALKNNLLMKNLDQEFGSKEGVVEQDDDYDYEEEEDYSSGIQTNFGSKPWSQQGTNDRPGSKGGSASSFFRNYAKQNVGGSFRYKIVVSIFIYGF